MNDKQTISRLIETLAIDLAELSAQLRRLAKSGRGTPGELERLVIQHQTVMQLLYILLQAYVAGDPAKEAVLDRHFFDAGLAELLAVNNIVPPAAATPRSPGRPG